MKLKRDEAYLYIKQRIIDRTWDVGTPININEICSIMGMSRTPVQEAMTRLEQEGFVSITPQVGAFVRRPTALEVFERFLTRAALEAVTAEWAAQKASSKQLYMLEGILKQMEQPGLPPHDYADLNREFHRIIHQAAGFKYVQSVVEQHWDYLEYTAGTNQLFNEEQKERSLAEHKIIFYSLKEGNAVLAKHLMESHMTRVARYLKEEIELSANRAEGEGVLSSGKV